MADQTTSVDIKWGKKDQETFRVDAKNLKEAGELLNKRDEWGHFEGHVEYELKTTGKLVTEVTLKPWYVISMPEWAGYDKAHDKCKTAWNKMFHKLADHEDGHREVHEKVLKEMEEYVEKAKNLTKEVLKKDFDKFVKTLKANQKKFDDQTGHGSKKGVVLDIAEECE